MLVSTVHEKDHFSCKCSGGSRERSQGAMDPPFQSIALVQLLTSYISVFVAIVSMTTA